MNAPSSSIQKLLLKMLFKLPLLISIQFITQFQYLLLNIIMNEIFSGNLECNYTRGEPLHIAMLFIIPGPIGIGCMLILIITEHPAYIPTQPQMLPDVGMVTYPECL